LRQTLGLGLGDQGIDAVATATRMPKSPLMVSSAIV